MIGYHYTSYKNWRRIKWQGLIPYKLNNEIQEYVSLGIWIWKHNFKGKNHLGTLLDRAIQQKCFKVVKLEIHYKKEDAFDCKVGDDKLVLDHTGSMEKWVYHKCEPVVVLIKKIPPKNIKLIKIYDLVKLTT
jgi:hypothetical protein